MRTRPCFVLEETLTPQQTFFHTPFFYNLRPVERQSGTSDEGAAAGAAAGAVSSSVPAPVTTRIPLPRQHWGVPALEVSSAWPANVQVLPWRLCCPIPLPRLSRKCGSGFTAFPSTSTFCYWC